jgi:hypothetical protein
MWRFTLFIVAPKPAAPHTGSGHDLPVAYATSQEIKNGHDFKPREESLPLTGMMGKRINRSRENCVDGFGTTDSYSPHLSQHQQELTGLLPTNKCPPPSLVGPCSTSHGSNTVYGRHMYAQNLPTNYLPPTLHSNDNCSDSEAL